MAFGDDLLHISVVLVPDRAYLEVAVRPIASSAKYTSTIQATEEKLSHHATGYRSAGLGEWATIGACHGVAPIPHVCLWDAGHSHLMPYAAAPFLRRILSTVYYDVRARCPGIQAEGTRERVGRRVRVDRGVGRMPRWSRGLWQAKARAR
jgi:hypothetical protein